MHHQKFVKFDRSVFIMYPSNYIILKGVIVLNITMFNVVLKIILTIFFISNIASIQANAKPAELAVISKEYDYKIYPILGDGNCQFRSIGHQLERAGVRFSDGSRITKQSFQRLRRVAADHILKNRKTYLPFINQKSGETQRQAFRSFIDRLLHKNEWGNEITLRALSREFNVNIIVISDTGYIRANIRPEARKSIVLGHIFETHYVSLIPTEENRELEAQRLNSIIESLRGVEVDKWIPNSDENVAHTRGKKRYRQVSG